MTGKKICDACALRSQCTTSKWGRRIQRLDEQTKIDAARLQSCSREAMAGRKRRRHLMEGSFADAANNHGFKRSRWRKLWRQRIQKGLIAACQNVRILLKWRPNKSANVAVAAQTSIWAMVKKLCRDREWILDRFQTLRFRPVTRKNVWPDIRAVWATRPLSPGSWIRTTTSPAGTAEVCTLKPSVVPSELKQTNETSRR